MHGQMHKKYDFHVFVPSEFDLRHFVVKVACQLLLTNFVLTKFEVSTGFLFRVNQRHGTDGRTDSVQHLMPLLAGPRNEGRVIEYSTLIGLREQGLRGKHVKVASTADSSTVNACLTEQTPRVTCIANECPDHTWCMSIM